MSWEMSWDPAAFETQLRTALDLDHPFPELSAFPELIPEVVRKASVLIVFGYREGRKTDPELLLTRRTDTLETHKGQIAFPGGVSDPEDEQAQGAVTTALRETQEEVGIPPGGIRVLGRLPELPTRTGFVVTPVVGLLEDSIERTPLTPSVDEIAECFWAPISRLLAPETYRQERFQVGARVYPIHVYQVGPHRVWGATAAMIKNLLDRFCSIG